MAKDKNKKPFNVLSKKGFATLALAGVMVASPFMLVGCGEAGPAGKDGATGATGATGAAGKSAYELAVDAGFTGTLEEWLESLKGTPGTSNYTHIRFAGEDPNDNDDMFEVDTTAGDWIGVYNGPSVTAPADYREYTWYKIKGEQGEPGEPGEGLEGKSSYTHIRYALDIDGTEMTETWQVGYNYIGFAVTNSETAPTDVEDYHWAKFAHNDKEKEDSKELDVSKLTWLNSTSIIDSTGSTTTGGASQDKRVVVDDFICVQPGDSIKLNSDDYKFLIYAYQAPSTTSYLNYIDTNPDDNSSVLKNWGNNFEFTDTTKLNTGAVVSYPLYIKLTVRTNDPNNQTTLTAADVKDLFEFNISADNSHINTTNQEGNNIIANYNVNPEFYNTNLIAHRGLATTAPENTMSAVEAAYKAEYKVVEVDIQMTKDNIPVLLHDATIDRMSNGTGSISQLTLEEARQYTYGGGITGYEEEQLPTLHEFLVYCKTRNILCELDLANRGFTFAQKKVIYDTVASLGMLGNTMFTATASELMGYLECNKNLIVSVSGITSVSIAESTLSEFKDCAMVFASVPVNNMTQELVSYVHTIDMKIKVHVLTKSNLSQLENALNWGVDLIMTDDITKLFEE